MDPRTFWPDDPVFIEIGVNNPDLALSLRRDGFTKYLGVSCDARTTAALEARHPELAGDLTHSNRPQLVRRNNAQVLILSGTTPLQVWKYRSVRHASYVVWQCRFTLTSAIALLGCLWHIISKRYSWPRVVSFTTLQRRQRKIFVTRVLRQRQCGQNSLHFIPYRLGVTGLFAQAEAEQLRYVVLRWFESLPEIAPDEDVDILVDDDCLPKLLDTLRSLPGIQPCDIYSTSGLARSDYCGLPYFPPQAAQRLLDRAVRYKQLCRVPDSADYFHSLAFHAVYHKGLKSQLPAGIKGLETKYKAEHDYAAILQRMADDLGIDVEISLEGLHAYLDQVGWSPSPQELARLAMACRRNQWLQVLAARLEPHLLDQGLAVFVLRQQAVDRRFTDQILGMIAESGFEIVATKTLSRTAQERGAAQTRGGNWTAGGPFDISGGVPAAVVIAYDPYPIAPSPKQRWKFRDRTNARIFIKEKIRDAIIAQLPPNQRFNAIHSSDHAAESWHLIDVLAPELLDTTRAYLKGHGGSQPTNAEVRRAA